MSSMGKTKIGFIISFFFMFCGFAPTPAFAAEEWVIDQFQSDIAIQESGKVRVVETILVDFKQTKKHGIFRELPIVYDIDGNKTYTEVTVESVLQNNTQAIYDSTKSDTFLTLKIGDPNQTISGKNSYTISYTVTGVLRSFSDYDEFYWDVTGTGWGVPITGVIATVSLPQKGIKEVTCFEGYEGSIGECKAASEEEQIARFTNVNPLDSYQGLTAVVSYQKGMVPILSVEKPKSFWEKLLEWPSLMTLGMALTAGLGTILFLWYRYGRDYWFSTALFGKKNDQGTVKPVGGHEAVVVEFTPPDKLRPAEIGVLMDERAHTHDVVATIIDLAGRGYLTITEIPKKWMFGKVDYSLHKKAKDTKGLLGYEKMLLEHLFNTGDIIKISELKQTFYTELKEIKKELYAEVVRKGFFPTNPEQVRSSYLAIAIVLIVLAWFIISFSLGEEIVWMADIGVGVMITGLVLLAVSQFMPRRTAYGRNLYRRIKGYQRFITSAEKYRQQFFEKKNMFNEVLPYAIAFGVTAKFAKQMKDMGVQASNPGWYTGTHAFSTNTFGASMNDFSKSVGTAIASTASSSSGFSGGGSSGGGFGGGGGGSW